MIKNLTSLAASLFLAGSAAFGLLSPSAQAQSTFLDVIESEPPEVKYECMMSPEGIPTTYARMNNGTENVPIIRWRSEYFRRSSWTPRRRCLSVSDRFQAFKQANQLRHLVPSHARSHTGTWYPVICTNMDSTSTSCAGLLITLELHENPNTILNEFLAAAAQGNSITRSGDGTISVDLDAYIRMVPSEEGVRPLD